MKVVRTCVLAAVLGGLALAVGCGGTLAHEGARGDDGGPNEDAAPPPTGTADSEPPPEDAYPSPPVDAAPCLVDLEPCINGGQCCSGTCENQTCTGPTPPPMCEGNGAPCSSPLQCCSDICGGGICGGVFADSGPGCFPDGDGCTTYLQCCSGVCGGGICGAQIFDSGPTCSPDGATCTTYLECCSQVCAGGFCGNGFTDSGPACVPDGVPCMTPFECCSGFCGGGICGGVFVDSGPPPVCVPPGGNQCDQCLAAPCCPQLSACENDPVCTASLNCFDACYVPGMGLSCAQKCGQMYPSANATALDQCAASACGPACQ